MLKPYDTYKETNIPWLKNIPRHWSLLRNASIFYEVVDTNHPNLELLSILITKGIVKQSSTGRKERMSADNTSYKRICVGDIGYNLMNAFIGGIGVSHFEGIISPAYAVCRFRDIDINNPEYYHYLYRTPLYMQEFDNHAYGIMIERNRLYFDNFKTICSPIPPLSEQDQIVRYLDWQTTKINKLINAKKKQIALLKEQKQAVINQAVTKGLDPNVEMKDSGVPWLGDIPKHWEVRKLRTLTKVPFQYGANESGIPHTVGNPRYIRITDIASDGSLKDGGKLSLLDSIATPYILDAGDILFARSGGTVGKSFIFMSEYGHSAFAGYLIRFKPNIDVLIPNYIYNFTLGLGYKIWLSQIFIQATIQNISAEKYKNLQIPLPPLKEQVDINNYIKLKSEIYERTIKIIEREIELVNEYKIRLVSDAVTGKIDVRGIVIPKFKVEDVIEDMEELDEVDEVEAGFGE